MGPVEREAKAKLLDALGLLAALRDHVDPSNASAAPFNRAWSVALVHAQDAAAEYAAKAGDP
jgi:hypothetical protein